MYVCGCKGQVCGVLVVRLLTTRPWHEKSCFLSFCRLTFVSGALDMARFTDKYEMRIK
jgi:hypothetical protein